MTRSKLFSLVTQDIPGQTQNISLSGSTTKNQSRDTEMPIICSTVFMAPEIGPKHHGALLFVQHSRSIKVEAFTDHFHLSEKHRWNFQVLRQSWGHPCHLGVHDVSYWTALGPSWPFAFKSQLPRRRSKQGTWNFSIPFTHFSVATSP